MTLTRKVLVTLLLLPGFIAPVVGNNERIIVKSIDDFNLFDEESKLNVQLFTGSADVGDEIGVPTSMPVVTRAGKRQSGKRSSSKKITPSVAPTFSGSVLQLQGTPSPTISSRSGGKRSSKKTSGSVPVASPTATSFPSTTRAPTTTAKKTGKRGIASGKRSSGTLTPSPSFQNESIPLSGKRSSIEQSIGKRVPKSSASGSDAFKGKSSGSEGTSPPSLSSAPTSSDLQKRGKRSSGKRSSLAGKGNPTPSPITESKKSRKSSNGKRSSRDTSDNGFSSTPSPSLPIPSPAPTVIGLIDVDAVSLTPFNLFYTFAAPSLPQNTEVMELESVTNEYLGAFMERTISNLNTFDVAVVDTAFRFGLPYEVFYNASATFTGMPPTMAELDALVQDAFIGSNVGNYLAEIVSLENNVFNTTTAVSLEDTEAAQARNQHTDEPKNSNLGVIIGGTIGGLLLAFFGIVGYGKRGEYMKRAQGSEKHAAHLTVAGYTCDESYAQTTDQSVMVRFKDTPSTACSSHWALPIQDLSEAETDSGAERSCLLSSEDDSEFLDESYISQDTGPPEYPSDSYTEETIEQVSIQSSLSVSVSVDQLTLSPTPDQESAKLSQAAASRVSGLTNSSSLTSDSNIESHEQPEEEGSTGSSDSGSLAISLGEESEDTNVPLRVVDLIRRFSPV